MGFTSVFVGTVLPLTRSPGLVTSDFESYGCETAYVERGDGAVECGQDVFA